MGKTMTENWIERWENGRTGWHEADGNKGLKRHWPGSGAGKRVLVPLCGKTPDLLWLSGQGHEVIGVELSAIAVRGFFDDHGLKFSTQDTGSHWVYSANNLPITIFQGDYLTLELPPCDALYDRGALVALPDALRPEYVAQTGRLLGPDPTILLITLEYDQSVVAGPPFSVLPEEVARYWPGLERVGEYDDLETCPPKFRQAGLDKIYEVVWASPPSGP
jgi:thiopurine S-methyltransferase